jgi:hypothetical protein
LFPCLTAFLNPCFSIDIYNPSHSILALTFALTVSNIDPQNCAVAKMMSPMKTGGLALMQRIAVHSVFAAKTSEAAPQSRPRESEQDDKWSFCLTAGTLCPANQERQ